MPTQKGNQMQTENEFKFSQDHLSLTEHINCSFNPFEALTLDEHLGKYFDIATNDGYISCSLKSDLYAQMDTTTQVLITLGFLSEDIEAENWDVELDQTIDSLMSLLEEYLNNTQCHKCSKICIRYILNVFDLYFGDMD